LEYADSVGYRRNALAAALRSGGAREIGLYAPFRPEGSAAELVFALAEAAASRGFALVLQLAGHGVFEPSRFEAVVALGPLAHDSSPLGTPIVEIGSTSQSHQIHPDDFGGSRRGVEYLLSLGHRRIAHFAGPQAEPACQERLRGFLDAVHEAGLRMDATPVFHSLSDLAGLLVGLKRPTSILAHSDEGAVAIYRCARAAGLRVPSDLSVVGFGNEAFGTRLQPMLTTISVDPEALALKAIQLVERLILREDAPPHTLIPTTLIVRESAVHPT
jgi:DNA-binding LacI/PurR family transcriptional regulator